MKSIELRAYYQQPTLVGSITISRVVGDKPVLYAIKGFDVIKQRPIPFKDVEFRSIQEAISAATVHGFQPNLWNTQTQSVA